MRIRLHIPALLCLALVVPAVRAQDAPTPEALLRQWHSTQVERTRTVQEVTFAEHTRRTTDGATGRREVTLDYRVTYLPRRSEWQREPTAMWVDGRPVNLERRRAAARTDGPFGPEFERFGRNTLFPAQLLARTRLAGPLLEEDLDGVPCWRMDVSMNTPRSPIQRITVWFDRRSGTLRQLRATVHTTRMHLTSEVTYERIRGLDVPSRRRTEGTLQARRRERTYAADVNVVAEYSDYAFLFAGER
jgi:hypothetical protein